MENHTILAEIFQGSDLAHGRSEPDNTSKAKGLKKPTRNWTVKSPPSLKEWEGHVSGTLGLGIAPINSESKVRFGAIDVDTYTGLDLSELAREIAKKHLPLILCASKSGGPHLFLFVSDWVPAELMVSKLDQLAAILGFGTSEIFPKQARIGEGSDTSDVGNWINMPYRGGTQRWAYDAQGDFIKNIPAFQAYVQGKMLSPSDLENFLLSTSDDLLPQGPPCLNHILSTGATDFRNVTLSNCAVYAKKAFPETWQEKIEEYNRLFTDPLESSEVEIIKKSYSKKDYKYQCSKEPLCKFCNSIECKQRQHGVGDDGLLPNNRSLTVIETVPPIWYLDIRANDNSIKRLSLSTEELQNPRLFQKRCMEVLHKMPVIPKQDVWIESIQSLLRYVTRIEMPPETSPTGQLIEHIQSFVIERKSDNSPEDMVRGNVYHAPLEYWFRWKDLKQWLDLQKFVLLKQHECLAALQELGAFKKFQHIAGTGVNFWVLPKDKLSAEEGEKLSVSAYLQQPY